MVTGENEFDTPGLEDWLPANSVIEEWVGHSWYFEVNCFWMMVFVRSLENFMNVTTSLHFSINEAMFVVNKAFCKFIHFWATWNIEGKEDKSIPPNKLHSSEYNPLLSQWLRGSMWTICHQMKGWLMALGNAATLGAHHWSSLFAHSALCSYKQISLRASSCCLVHVDTLYIFCGFW